MRFMTAEQSGVRDSMLMKKGNGAGSRIARACPGLDGQSGKFKARGSNLRGMLRKYPDNPKQWRTDDGEWFLNLSDTAYMLFHWREKMWKEYVRDLDELGVTSTRCFSLGGGDSWEEGDEVTDTGEAGKKSYKSKDEYNHDYNYYPWVKKDMSRFDLQKFQTTDERLVWMLDNYPGIYVAVYNIWADRRYRTGSDRKNVEGIA